VKTLTREELQALLVTGDLALIEALPQAHYDKEYLPGALNVPDALDADLAAALVPDPGTTVVTYQPAGDPRPPPPPLPGSATPTCGSTSAARVTDCKPGCIASPW
jgi:hypothetical protein